MERMKINRFSRLPLKPRNSHGANFFSWKSWKSSERIWMEFFSISQLKQKHPPPSHPKPKHLIKVLRQASIKTLKPADSYLVPNPKFHLTTEKSSGNNSATPADALDPHQHQSSTLNPVYEYSEEINAQAEKDFNERRQHLWEVCERSKIIGKFTPNAWEFFISPGHGLAWCNVFKAASTTWMYYFNILGEFNWV